MKTHFDNECCPSLTPRWVNSRSLSDHECEHDCPVATNQEQILVAAAAGNIYVPFFDKTAELFGFFDAGRGVLKELYLVRSGAPGDGVTT